MNTQNIKIVVSDYWRAYINFIPKSKHIQSQA